VDSKEAVVEVSDVDESACETESATLLRVRTTPYAQNETRPTKDYTNAPRQQQARTCQRGASPHSVDALYTD